MELLVTRGCPGSGKSHKAQRVAGDPAKVFSADTFFDIRPGGYRANFKVELLPEAHAWNQSRVRAAMFAGVTPVVVDNTNLRVWQARPYVEMATEFGYKPRIVESDSPWWKKIRALLADPEANSGYLDMWAYRLHAGFYYKDQFIRNTHGVAAETLRNMLQQYTSYTITDVRHAIIQADVERRRQLELSAGPEVVGPPQ